MSQNKWLEQAIILNRNKVPAATSGFSIGLPPRDAIAYLKSKKTAVTPDTIATWNERRVHVFTIEGCARLDVVEEIYAAILASLQEGKDERWFVKAMQPVLEGNILLEEGETVSDRLLQVYDCTVHDAYMAGRYREQLANCEDRPYWQYSAKIDDRTRPNHRALHGLVFRFDDPFWQTHYPPNGLCCRCRVRALSQRDLVKEGLPVSESAGHMVTKTIQRTDCQGQSHTLTVSGYQAEQDGEIYWTDEGFSCNSGFTFLGLDSNSAQLFHLT